MGDADGGYDDEGEVNDFPSADEEVNGPAEGGNVAKNIPKKGKDNRHRNLKIQDMAALLVEGRSLVFACQPDDEGPEDVAQRNVQQQGERRKVAAENP